MRHEAAYTSDVLRALRLLKPTWIVHKHNDRMSAGLPDAFVISESGTTFIEFKRSPSEAPNILTLLTPAQERFLNKLEHLGTPYLILVRTPTRWRMYTLQGFVLDLPAAAKETAACLTTRLS